MSPVQVFEWGKLRVGEAGFTKAHLKALALYNEKHEGKYFTLLFDGVRFANYVGVIQVGNLTVEILPKADKTAPDGDKTVWQRALLTMLRECRSMKVDTNEDAALRLKHNSILEAYLDIFLAHCRKLLHEGLVKKYRRQESNTTALKGRLLIAQNIRQNLVHGERFYAGHTVYDSDNVFNRILRKAIRLVADIAGSAAVRSKASTLLLDWPELPDIVATDATFDRLVFDRKTSRYLAAIQVARMLLLNYRPDISSGRQHVLAILFDMNKLWEEFILRRVRAAISDQGLSDWEVEGQDSGRFWKNEKTGHSKTVRPDIVLKHRHGTQRNIVIDTKWKMPDQSGPSDEDLKQMLVYNLYWDCEASYLLYPQTVRVKGQYHHFDRGSDEFHSGCSLISVPIMVDGKLCPNIGSAILMEILGRVDRAIGGCK